jgi:deoxyadenosine/deoxycytidine kinase
METIIHPITADGKEFLESLDERNRQVHALAKKELGSSYFVEKTAAFRAWFSSKNKAPKMSAKITPNVQSPAAK